MIYEMALSLYDRLVISTDVNQAVGFYNAHIRVVNV